MSVRGGLRRLLVVLFLLTPTVRAADERPAALVPGESRGTASRIAEADRRFAAKKWAEGLDELQAVLDTAGDDLAPIDATHSVRARRLVHIRIAALPANELQRYRDRVDVQARRWLEQGFATRDAALLRKIVDEAFCSRPAEQALELLGDLAFERGQFSEAEGWWQLLAPLADSGKRPGELVYPGPLRDAARVRAKQLMALHFQGLRDYRDRRLEEQAARLGSASGVLGGRSGKYADMLAQLFAAPIPRAEGDADWSTFAGDAARGRVQPAPARLLDRLSIMCRGGPALHISLPAFGPADEAAFDLDKDRDLSRVRQRGDFARSLTFHPLIVGGRLLVADTGRVMAFDLRHPGARGVELYSLGFDAPEPRLDQRCTLTVADSCVYARLGEPRVDEKAASLVLRQAKALENRIVSLRLDPEPGQGQVCWIERGLTGANAKIRGKVIFEGAPIARNGFVYVAATRFEAGKTVTAVHCYSAEPPARTTGAEPPEPHLLWHTDVGDLREPGSARYRHHLLTLAGPLVVCCTRAGSVVALDASTGRREWAVHSRGRVQDFDDRPALTDLVPCVYADGKLYAAPDEGGCLLCIDAETGRTVWLREAIDVVHLLGVGSRRLIFTTPTGLRAVNSDSGDDKEGWSREARTEYGKDGSRSGWSPAGRGFLAGEYVFWPAIDPAGNLAVHALRQDTGEADDNPTLLHRLPVGNLVYAEGCIAVAGAEQLAVFVPPAWQMSERERGVKVAPTSATAALALARSEADASLFSKAAENYARAEQLASRATGLGRVAREERQGIWLDAGRRALESQHWDEAKGAFGRAAGAEFPPADRARALLEAADAWKGCARWDEQEATLRAVLDSEELRETRLSDLARAGDRACERFRSCTLRDRGKASAPAALAVAKSPGEATAERVGSLPLDPAAPSLPLRQDWDLALDPAEELLPTLGGDLFLTALRGEPGEVVARKITSGRERWRSRVSFNPTRAFGHADLVLVTGSDGIAALRREDGAELWHCLPSQIDRQHPLNHFRLSGSQLTCLQGERRLLICDAESGVVRRFTRPVAEPGVRSPVAAFVPYNFVGPGNLRAQSSDGICQVLPFGKMGLHAGSITQGLWSADPVAYGSEGASVSVAGSRQVVFSGGEYSDLGWTYSVPGVTTLTGRPARVAVVGDAILLLVETNIGYQLQRLSRATGKPLWPMPVLLHESVSDPADWAAGEESVCLVEHGVLTAHSLRDGKALWETPLGDPVRPWHLERVANGLLAYPAATTGRQFAFRWLTRRLQWIGVPDTGEAVGHGFPVVCYDLAGRLVQRFDLASRGVALRYQCMHSGGLFITPSAAAWRGSAAGCLPVQVSACGIVVVVGPHAWGFCPAAAK
jgi:outer membrane protein assembly factor BamB